MSIDSIVLFVILLLSIHIASNISDYSISIIRKVAGAIIFVGLDAAPVGFLSFPLAFIGLYIVLVNRTHNHALVTKTFGLTFLFSSIGILIVYIPLQMLSDRA